MNFTYVFSLVSFLALISVETTSSIAQELASPDTLILQTVKHKGHGLFGGGFGRLDIQDIAENDALRDQIPPEISSPTVARCIIDFKPFAYRNIQSNNPENLEAFVKANHPTKIDTANVPSEQENSLRIILGVRGADSVYIVDENGNDDYRDDPVRKLQKLIYELDAPIPDPVLCHYWLYNGTELVRDSGWVIVALGRNNIPRFSMAQYVSASIDLNHQTYEVQVVDWIPSASFCFETPIISISAHNGVQKDSLLLSERLDLGEYLKLGESYYKFDKITNDGSEITLIKEDDVSDKIGKQVGFLAPDFTSISTEGDSVSPMDYQNEYVLLVNITACWSEPMSYVHYKALSDKYLSSLNILAIDASSGPLQANIEELGLEGTFVLSGENRAITEHYREDFCSRECFLISSSGHLVDKFQIYDWESSLAKHFK